MKRNVILGIVFSLLLGVFSINSAFAESQNTDVIKEAINKYKNKNYLGCISDLRMYTEKDPSSAIALYYLGNAYMNIAMKTDAHKAFDKVVQLNTVPKLTSYSIQAKICMENPAKCDYQNFSYQEIVKLKADPLNFLEEYFANLNGSNTVDADTLEIEKLIKGSYSNNMHPSVKDFIMQERAKMKQNEINANKAYLPSDDKLSQALDLIKQQNNDVSAFAMFMDNDKTTTNNTDYIDLIKQYQNQENNSKLSPEVIQMMMMNNMMPAF